MYIKNKTGQSTVEYVLLVTAVVAVIIALAAGSNSQFQKQLNTTLNQTVSTIGDLGDRLQNSEAASPAGGNGTPPYIVNVSP